MDRVFMVNETAANCCKMRITEPDLSTRRVFGYTTLGNYPTAVVHGKNCDICSCSGSGASATTGYCDTQSFDAALRTNWAPTKALVRSGYLANPISGVFCLFSGYSVGFSAPFSGSRL